MWFNMIIPCIHENGLFTDYSSSGYDGLKQSNTGMFIDRNYTKINQLCYILQTYDCF